MARQYLEKRGYYTVAIYENGVRKFKKVHRLVAEAFIPNPENKSQVNHIDGNKLNNDVSNLEWATNSENQKHAYKVGLQKIRRGKSSPMFRKTHTEESKQKISKSKKGSISWNKGKTGVYSEETLKNMSEAKKGKMVGRKNHKSIPILCIETGEIFESINLASKKFNCSESNIRRVLKGKQNKCANMHWKYI